MSDRFNVRYTEAPVLPLLYIRNHGSVLINLGDFVASNWTLLLQMFHMGYWTRSWNPICDYGDKSYEGFHTDGRKIVFDCVWVLGALKILETNPPRCPLALAARLRLKIDATFVPFWRWLNLTLPIDITTYADVRRVTCMCYLVICVVRDHFFLQNIVRCKTTFKMSHRERSLVVRPARLLWKCHCITVIETAIKRALF